MMKPAFKVAVIGCGAIAPIHVSAILAAGQELAALCDVNREAALALKEKLGLGEIAIYTDWRKMLDAEQLDAVHICTPHYLHATMCIEALTRNLSVLCEKPLCIRLEELDEILAAAKKEISKVEKDCRVLD